MNNVPCIENTETIIPGIQGIYVTMRYEYDAMQDPVTSLQAHAITVFRVLKYPYNIGTNMCKNSDCVTVIQYMK